MSSPDETSPDNDLQKTLKLYSEGKPLFTRAVLEDLDHHLEKGEKKVMIRDYLNKEHIYDLEIPDWCADSAYVRPMISNEMEQILKETKGYGPYKVQRHRDPDDFASR